MRFFSFSKTLSFYRFINHKNASTKKTLLPELPKINKGDKRKTNKKIQNNVNENVIVEETEISQIGSLIEYN